MSLLEEYRMVKEVLTTLPDVPLQSLTLGKELREQYIAILFYLRVSYVWKFMKGKGIVLPSLFSTSISVPQTQREAFGFMTQGLSLFGWQVIEIPDEVCGGFSMERIEEYAYEAASEELSAYELLSAEKQAECFGISLVDLEKIEDPFSYFLEEMEDHCMDTAYEEFYDCIYQKLKSAFVEAERKDIAGQLFEQGLQNDENGASSYNDIPLVLLHHPKLRKYVKEHFVFGPLGEREEVVKRAVLAVIFGGSYYQDTTCYLETYQLFGWYFGGRTHFETGEDYYATPFFLNPLILIDAYYIGAILGK